MWNFNYRINYPNSNLSYMPKIVNARMGFDVNN